MSAYLEVPPQAGIQAFCDALVLAIKEEQISLYSLLTIARERNDDEMFLEVGRLLRIVYFLHRRASTVSLEGPAAQ